MIDRRRALQRMMLSTVASYSLLQRPLVGQAAGGRRAQTSPVRYPVPPSLMLHSEFGTNTDDINGFLPVLVRLLRQDGYQGLTYLQWLTLMENHEPPPPKPVLISIDDLTMAEDGPTFSTFVAMRDYLIENGYPVTFAVVNRLDLPQDAERWALVRGWVEQGSVELASHTDQHINFNQKDGSPRNDLDATAYQRQIAESALQIGEAIGVPVKTLITPFGSGFQRYTQTIHAAVLDQCQQVGIRFVVGIPDGRLPIVADTLGDATSVMYVGRTKPPSQNKTAVGAMYELNLWYEHDYAPYLTP